MRSGTGRLRRLEQRLGRHTEEHTGNHAADRYERRKGSGANDGDLDDGDKRDKDENGQRKRTQLVRLRKRTQLGIERREQRERTQRRRIGRWHLRWGIE
jgi:hypothetical protein